MGRGLHAESRQIIQRAYDNLEVEHPSGVRRVAYALYGNQAGAMVKKLGKLLVRARKDGDIPWEWINDSTRLDVLPFVVNDAGDMCDVHRSCPSYDPWQQQPVRVIVWTEKSVAARSSPCSIHFWSDSACTSNTSASKIQAVVSAMATDQRRLVILYCGDHDAKGLLMGAGGDEFRYRCGFSPQSPSWKASWERFTQDHHDCSVAVIQERLCSGVPG
jgi:hypothetical protein